MDDFRELDFFGAIHPEERSQTTAEWQNAVQHQKPYQADIRIRNADGDYIWYAVQASPLRRSPAPKPSPDQKTEPSADSDSSPCQHPSASMSNSSPASSATSGGQKPLISLQGRQWLGVFGGVQRPAKADVSLLQEKEFLNAVLANLSDGIVACNADGTLTLLNRATQDLHNLPAKPVPAHEWKNYCDIFQADGKTPIATEDTPLLRALKGESVRDVEMKIVPKQGSPRTILASGDVIVNDDGMPLGAVVAMKDISRRKEAETALQSLNAELETRVSERTRQLEQSHRELEREIETRKQFEQRLLEQNQILLLQNKELELQRQKIQQQNLQLMEASRMKSRFLATMSHELRTPMNAIIGFSQLLLRQQKTPLPPHTEDMVRRILNNGKKLLTMVNELLDFSKAEAGRLDVNPCPCDLHAIALTTVDELRSLAIKKNLELQLHCCLETNYATHDPVRLRQILVNLVSNAIKFTEKGYVRISIAEANSDPTGHAAGEWHRQRIAIRVEDTGIGMAPDTIKTIFEPFQQLDQSDSRRYEGAGLGLAIVRSLVAMMRGTIHVESQLGRGTTFRIEIPRFLDALPSHHEVANKCVNTVSFKSKG